MEESKKGHPSSFPSVSKTLVLDLRSIPPAAARPIAGLLGSEDFDDPRAARKIWGAAKLVKATLQKLFFHGRLLIAQRANNRRRYDLPERVLPPAVLAQPKPPAAETARWLALLKLRQRRLVTLKREELRLIQDRVQPVTVPGCPTLYCRREDVRWFDGAADSAADQPAAVSLLAPLDPLIYDRRLTAALWNFNYTWEAYTPPQKRVRGHYALPVLVGLELVGHVNPRADRERRKLVVVSRQIRRGHRVAPALREFARWLFPSCAVSGVRQPKSAVRTPRSKAEATTPPGR